MELRNCPECGKVFTYIRTNLCPACQEKDEKNFRLVRSFIVRNPSANIKIVSEETGVSETSILRYLKEERISLASNVVEGKLTCEICGATISSGRLCKACAEKLTTGIKREFKEENERQLNEIRGDRSRMYTADRRRYKRDK